MALADELNKTIKTANPAVYNLLSKRGRAIFFPYKGILGQTAEAKGSEINATIGIACEDDGSPMRLDVIEKQINLDAKDVFPYAPSFGKPELRDRWRELIFDKNPSLTGNVSNPIVTNALTHALSLMGYMFVEEGDSIILPDYFWGNYKLTFANGFGATLDTFPTFKGKAFNLEGLKEKLSTPGKKIILLNFPNNPTGYTVTEKEADQIQQIILEAADKEILVICDDAYFGLVYKDGILKESIFTKLNNLHENVLAVKIDGATKEDYVWGLRVGFITYGIKGGSDDLYKALEDKTAGAVRGTISNVPHLSQSIVLNALNDANYRRQKEEKYQLLKSRYDAVVDVLNEYPGSFEPLPFNSGYFMCIKMKDAENVRQILLDKFSTGVIATGDVLRIAFSATPTDKIKKLFQNIHNA